MAKFKVGDRVIVVSNCKSMGKTGMVINCLLLFNPQKYTYEVELDNGNVYSYYEESLEFAENYEEATEKYNINYRVAKIRFVNNYKEYYYALYDSDIEVGDNVVVASANHGKGVAVVTAIIDNPTKAMIYSCNQGREIIAKFDMSAYNTRKENRTKLRKLKAEMKSKINEIKEMTLYEIMAEKSPEFKEMLQLYNNLKDTV